MTPQERAASVISRIGATTDKDSLAQIIAEEIRAAVAERDAPAVPPVSVAMEHPPRVGRAAIGRPEGPPAFKLVRHHALTHARPSDPFCDICWADAPGPGKTTLYMTSNGYHCETCMYDEYIQLKTKHMSLFAVQYQAAAEVRSALVEDFRECGDGDEEVDEELVGRLADEIARGIRDDEYLKPFPDIVSMLMRRVFYEVLREHQHELPDGFELPGPGVEL
jgi:hypothetical protein